MGRVRLLRRFACPIAARSAGLRAGPDFRGRRVDLDLEVGDVGRALVDFAFLGELIEGGEARPQPATVVRATARVKARLLKVRICMDENYRRRPWCVQAGS